MPAGPSHFFPASYDLTVKIVSAAALVLTLVPAILAHMHWLALIAVPIAAFGYAYSARGYEVSDRAIVVKRLIGDVHIPLENVVEARRAGPDDLTGCVRLWGSGGLFGYYGLFRTKKLGVSRWYLTNRRDMAVVIGEGKPAIFSPDNVDGFLVAIHAAAPASNRIRSERPAPIGFDRRRPIAGLVGLLLAFLGVGAAILASLYTPGLPDYRLTRDALAIRDRFYSVTVKADTTDVGGIRVVDLTAEPDWRPVRRTNGFSNKHYHSGWFQTAGGQRARMYWADGHRLVLLPPKGGGVAVLFEAADPDRLAEEIRREWSNRAQ